MDFKDVLDQLLGLNLEPKQLSVTHVTLRALVVFTAALVMVRLGDKRFLARLNAADAIVGFILASMLSRAINGSAALFPTIIAGFAVVLLHRFLAALAYRSDRFGKLIKGKEDVVVERGQVREHALRCNHISGKDLLEELRLNGNTEDLHQVQKAVIERNGEISIIRNGR